jgi:hypothetical protein
MVMMVVDLRGSVGGVVSPACSAALHFVQEGMTGLLTFVPGTYSPDRWICGHAYLHSCDGSRMDDEHVQQGSRLNLFSARRLSMIKVILLAETPHSLDLGLS